VSGKIINLENVCYSYPRARIPALNGINLSVTEGEFLAVMGENGSGKTTFCKLINGIIPHLLGGHLTGTVTVDGERTDESSVPRLALKAGIVLDDPDAQLFTSSVCHEAAFGPENLLLPPQEIEERVRQSLRAAGLAGFEKRQPATLSGGEKQRLCIAAALVMKSKILVLDEPLCRLDPEGEAEVMSVLRNIRTQYGMTVIMTAHDSARMLEFADRVCVLKNGCVAACDSAKNIFVNHALLEENGIRPPVEADIFSVFTEKADKLPVKKNEAAAIEIKDFSYSYVSGSVNIENINLSIADNDFIALIGRNGCGKTTLLKNIAGLLRPDAGEIYIRGKNSKELTVPVISKEIGFVMQNTDNQLFTDSVFNEVAFALKNSGFSKTEIRSRVEDALRAVGIEEEDAFPHALNRADRTRTVIACVLAMGCKIIILDEVDVGQDHRGSLRIMDIARELHSKGFTIIFVTHNMSLACEYAHRLIMMDKKGIVMDRRKKNEK
jgi:energy-coupling factor transport system ATP-binding protein